MPSTSTQLAAHDLAVGAHVARRELTLDTAEFMQFSTLTGDRHPIHYDPVYARDKGFRGPVAHGLLLLGISALGATTLSERLHDCMVAMTGTSAQFLRPVIAGDRLRLDYRVASIQPRDADHSLVSFDVEVAVLAPTPTRSGSPACVISLTFLLKNRLGT
ncbi:MaoC family dehydratase [Achromobacter aloeverae]|uniref:MaoC-like domain-containing protein n=1 Tax=Achromobacter aloeverae TaxID=1750518 RepID=A0A4Q1HCR4_9BURK|nr:MaoC family dehydratase [Achromobacter aloeverae]RXN83353.1 hypothetical protein C7R54_28175 [Achromobacter aloeverae]